MFVVAVAVAGVVVGFAVVIFAAQWLLRSAAGTIGPIFQAANLGAACLLGAGVLWALGGGLRLVAHVAEPVWRTHSMQQLALVLQEPIENVQVNFDGANPFSPPSKTIKLRFRLTTQDGSTIVSEVAAADVKPLSEKERNSFIVNWTKVLAGCKDDAGRTALVQLRKAGDWRYVSTIECHIVQESKEAFSSPRNMSMNMVHNKRSLVELFVGKTTKLKKDEDPQVVRYLETGPSPAERIWNMRTWARESPETTLGTTFIVLLVGGGLLFLIGAAALRLQEVRGPATPPSATVSRPADSAPRPDAPEPAPSP